MEEEEEKEEGWRKLMRILNYKVIVYMCVYICRTKV